MMRFDTDTVALANDTTDFGHVPSDKAEHTAQGLANTSGKPVKVRHPESAKVLGTVKPAKTATVAGLKAAMRKAAAPRAGKPTADQVAAADADAAELAAFKAKAAKAPAKPPKGKPAAKAPAKGKRAGKPAKAAKAPAKKAKAAPAKKAMPAKAKAAGNGAPKAGTKSAMLMELLKGKGSTVEAMCKKLDWQAHTLRAALTRLPGGAKVERTRDDGVTSYRLA